MSSRGPFTGPGDAPTDIGPPTGPPAGAVAESATDPTDGATAGPVGTSAPDLTLEPVPEPAAEQATAPDHVSETATELGSRIAAEPALDVAEAAVEQDTQSVAAPASEAAGALLAEPAAEPANNTLMEPARVNTAESPSEITAQPTTEIIAVAATDEAMPADTSPASEITGVLLAEPAADLANDTLDKPTPEPDAESEVQGPAEPFSEHAVELAPHMATQSAAEPAADPAAGMAPPSTTVDLPPPPHLAVPEPIAAPPLSSGSVWPGRLRRVALIFSALVVGYAALVLILIVAYRWVDPPRSALMLTTRLSGQPVLYAPVPITKMSSYLQRAVVTSEDARFCYHHGVDWGALFEAMNEARGGSTITMQTAKNLFLWPSRSYIRKAIEIPVALTIDAFWPKRRILEVYLNIAEWGPGIFGAEAAAHYHFDKPASRLTSREAALLAASLPNPIARDAGEPGRITALLASRLRGRMAHSDAFVSCLGLRPTPRPTPRSAPPKVPRAEPKAAPKPAPKSKPAAKDGPELPPWRTTTDPAVNPWQN